MTGELRDAWIPETACLSCGLSSGEAQVMEDVFIDEDGRAHFEEGHEITCTQCGAVHEVVADGLRLTGQREGVA